MNKRRFKGYDYEAHNHPDLVRRAEKWVHKGGGYYENTVTRETRRGKPAVDAQPFS